MAQNKADEIGTDTTAERGKKIVVVLGMHRSGTSTITRALRIFGADLGERLMPAVDGDNAKGFWEDLDVNNLNIKLLQALGLDWHTLTLITEDDLRSGSVADLKAQAVRVLIEKTGSVDLFALKDPRMARVLPFWKEAVQSAGLDARYLIIVRNPLSVVRSLQKRNGFAAEKSYHLWIEHVAPCLQETAEARRVIVDYDRLMDQPGVEIRRIGHALGLADRIDEEELLKFQAEYLDAGLRHTRYSLEDLANDAAAPAHAIRLFSLLAKLSADELFIDDPAVRQGFTEAAGHLNDWKPALRYVDRLDAEIEKLHDAASERDAHISELNASAAFHNARIADLDRALLAKERQFQDTQSLLNDANKVLTEHELELALITCEKIKQDKHLERSLKVNAMLSRSRDELLLELQKYGRVNYLLNRLLRGVARNAVYFCRLMLGRLRPGAQSHGIDPADIKKISDSGLFMADWYLSEYQDISAAGIDPLLHYLDAGGREGRKPNPVFDSAWYLAEYPDIAAAGINPLVHYLREGANDARNPAPVFDSAWYLAENPDVLAAGTNPLEHYLRHGGREGRKPNPCFDSAWYLEQNPDVAKSDINPLVHYLVTGAKEGRKPHPLFDSAWYLTENPDVAEADINPLVHYLSAGAKEGRKPNPLCTSAHAVDAALPLAGRDMRIYREYTLRNNRKKIEKIRFETFVSPRISIIIPIYNKIDYTVRCLESICEYPPAESFEIIIVDDCSSDNTIEKLGKIEGLKIVQNEANEGFIKSCNKGAGNAKGEYLLFLNNDTEITRDAVDQLVRTFHEFPGTGLAGSKLVYPDGKLQEAGGIIWQDGSAWNFGRNQDPTLPVYNYAREVDYCSGASIMVPKSLFEDLGGFDEHYSPAYCEDSDLALKIRDQGLRVIYQPLSVVVHYEGVTSGTDVTQGAKAYQVENSKKLFARWKKRLELHQAPGVAVDQAKDRMAKRRALVLDHCTPTPDQDAGSVTVFNLLLLLREMDFQVTFIPSGNFLYMPEYTPALQRAGIEVLYSPYCTSVEEHLKDFGGRYELAFLFRPDTFDRHFWAIRKFSPQARVLYHTVDLHYLRMAREAQLLGDAVKQKTADEMKQTEVAILRAADASIVHSTIELGLLRPCVPEPERIHVFPLIMNIRGTNKSFKDRADIVFVGGYQHTPNVDAVQYFVGDVMPLLRRRLPGVRFYAVGSKPPAEMQALSCEDVIITGFVEDLDSLLDRMRVSVAPLRYGAGIKGKIGTAMAVGLPTVATPLAAEGMSLTNSGNILVADGAEDLADAVAGLYEEEAMWNRLSAAGLDFARQEWGAEAAYRTLGEILKELGINSTRNNRSLRLYGSTT